MTNSEWGTCSDCGHNGPTYAGDCDKCGGPVTPPVRPAALTGQVPIKPVLGVVDPEEKING